MNGMAMSLPLFVMMMAAMMLPSAVPAIVRTGRDGAGALAAPRFAGSYLGIWTLVGLAMWLLYQPPGQAASGALLIGAGAYELTPMKRECRRRCRERLRSGAEFGRLCFGSSIGLMLVAVNVMNVALMLAIAAVAAAQKLFPPHRAFDLSLALAIVALGIATAAA